MTQEKEFQTISIIGLGYIGLPTAAVFANHKMKVIGVDVNQQVVDTINSGKIHIVEPGLDMAVDSAVKNGFLSAVTKPLSADAFMVAVPTPFKVGPNSTHTPDLDYIESASKSIAPVLKKGDLVVLESTSPVGSTEKMAQWLADARPDLSFPQTHGEASDIRVAHCPERVLPGQVLRELVNNDRVIGGMTPRCSIEAIRLYKTFLKGHCFATDTRTAEMCKLIENSFRDVNIAFANELSIICEKLNINVWDLIGFANRHPRVNILQPGPGVGGHCIAVDPWFIVHSAPKEAKLISKAREINDEKPLWVLKKIKQAIAQIIKETPDKTVEKIKVAFYGITFKADIDDMRESPAMTIIKEFTNTHRGEIHVIDPNIKELPDSIKKVIMLNQSEREVEDIGVLLVDHKEFKENKSRAAHIIDTRGIWTQK